MRKQHPGWTDVDHSLWSTAPCDWLAQLPSDLTTYHPATVTIATAGNTQGTACMTDAYGSPSYFTRYQSDLNSITGYKGCLKTEGAAQGCGLPEVFPPNCTVYSSGELRFGEAIGKAATKHE